MDNGSGKPQRAYIGYPGGCGCSPEALTIRNWKGDAGKRIVYSRIFGA